MAGVDVCHQVADVPLAVPAAAVSEIFCTACAENFASAVEHRAHCKSERHLYNTKRRLAGLKPISQEAWERKLKESRGAAAAANEKGTAHLKPGKEQRKGPGTATPSSSKAEGASDVAAAAQDEEPWTPMRSLFDKRRFETIEENLAYMNKTYSFFIPDRDYCTDIPGLLSFLGRKISEPPHLCICCNRSFPDMGSVRRHMIDKCHTRLLLEARTRRGFVDEAGTEHLQAEVEAFYDFHGSTREITERMTPQQQTASLLRYFDEDRDGRLRFAELAQMWTSMSDGAELSEAQYVGACGAADVDPAEGLDTDALGRLYDAGVVDRAAHFAVLQDLVARRLASRKQSDSQETEAGEDGDDAEDEDEEEEGDDDGDGEDNSGSEGSDGTEIVECEDEDEFEEVMRILGLQRVTVTGAGDLRLPNGCVATHRDVQHIYKQRGRRMDQLATLPEGSAASRPRKGRSRAQLMLSNAASSGCLIAMSRREEARQGKRIVAVLKRQQMESMQLGLQNNKTMKQRGSKIQTGRGDCSYGR